MSSAYCTNVFVFQEGGRKSARQPSKLEREGVINLDEVNFEQALIAETSQGDDENEQAKKKRERSLKRRSGQARIKDTTQSKKLKAEKKKAKIASSKKGRFFIRIRFEHSQLDLINLAGLNFILIYLFLEFEILD